MTGAVLVLGAGDMGSAIAHSLHGAGFAVAIADGPAPAHPRRAWPLPMHCGTGGQLWPGWSQRGRMMQRPSSGCSSNAKGWRSPSCHQSPSWRHAPSPLSSMPGCASAACHLICAASRHWSSAWVLALRQAKTATAPSRPAGRPLGGSSKLVGRAVAEASTVGYRGGGATLTDAGRNLIADYRAIERTAQRAAEPRLAALLRRTKG